MIVMNYNKTLTLVKRTGESLEIRLCRIENDRKIFTKDKMNQIVIGDKIFKPGSDSSQVIYEVVSILKINILGSIEINVKKIF